MSQDLESQMEILQRGIIDLFARVARDVEKFSAQPAEKSDTKRQAEIISRTPFGISVVLGAPSRNPSEQARTLTSKYAYALSVCSNSKEREKLGPQLANALIAKWTGAQMYRIVPELIKTDDTKMIEEIQTDINNVRTKLQRFKGINVETDTAPQSFKDILEFLGRQDTSDNHDKDDQTKIQVASEILSFVHNELKI